MTAPTETDRPESGGPEAVRDPGSYRDPGGFVYRRKGILHRQIDAASIDVTVREDHVRASVAIFNNSDEVERLLAVTRRIA